MLRHYIKNASSKKQNNAQIKNYQRTFGESYFYGRKRRILHRCCSSIISSPIGFKKIDALVLDNHLKTCVADSIKRGDGKKVVDEVIKVIEKK